MRADGAPKSRLQGVVEAIRFTHYTFSIDGLCESLLSSRCIGAARKLECGPKRQASPFTVDQLVGLHLVLEDESVDVWDRLMAGCTLCAVYTRSRWMDLQHTDSVQLDPNPLEPVYIELEIAEFKTKRSRAWMAGVMQAVGPCLGVVPENWASTWWTLRHNLEARLEEGYSMMPAPDSDGLPTKRPIQTDEMGAWIRVLLKQRGLLPEESRITSHSCKATLLSWLSKYGADVPVREILGGHAARLKTVLCYSRDSLAAPLRVLDQLLVDVREKRFRPDLTHEVWPVRS